MNMNDLIQNMIARRSCKCFLPDMVPDECIEQIIQAGLYAPNAMAMQSPIIIAVKDKAQRGRLSRLNAKYDLRHRADPFYGAPVVLAVVVPKEMPTGIYDGSLVLGNMLLAAHALGLGACWIHRAKESFEDEDGKALLAELGLKGEYEGVGNCVIGYPERMNTALVPRKEGRVYRL